jgi:hypothetical protein
MMDTERSFPEGSCAVIETIDHNRIFRATRWALTPVGRILSVFLAIGLTFVGALAAGIDIHGKPMRTELILSPMILVVSLLLSPRLSQRWRTVGANCIPILSIRQEVRRERVTVPLFSYVSPLGVVVALAFCGIVFVVFVSPEIDTWWRLRDEATRRILIEVLLFAVISVVLLIIRHFKRSAEDAMAIVGTSPVVVLRSFVDDTGHASGRGQGRFKHTFEQLVARQLRRYGPFVAIGRPGEALPQLGAARTYTSDAEWQEKALAMMAASRLIAVIVGATPGLGWELGQIVKRGWTDKLLILFPLLSASERSARISVLASLLAGTRWGASLEAADGAWVVAARLAGDGSITLIAATGDSPDNTFYDDAIKVALHGILCRDQMQVIGMTRNVHS